MKKHKMSKWSVLMLVLVMVFLLPVVVSAEEETPASGIKVYMTINDKGVIAKSKDGEAMAWKEVTVADRDSDGKYSYDEALVAVHDAYYEGGAEAGYISGVKKLWGTETVNALFFTNGMPIETGVTGSYVSEGDHLTASVNKDEVYSSDWMTSFDKYEATVKKGESLQLNLSGFLGAPFEAAGTVKTPEPIEGATVGILGENGLINTQKTDDQGNVTLSFDTPGIYIISAQGSVEAGVPDYNTTNEDGQLMGITHDDDGNPVYGYMNMDTYECCFAYTLNNYGEGPYPPSEILKSDYMELFDIISEYDFSEFDEGYILRSNMLLLDCPLIPPCCIVRVPADPADVTVTISNQGVLAAAKDGTAMVKKEVTVTDLNEDGKLTVDEAMVATHEAYFEGGTDGYLSELSPYGYYWVTNLWGVKQNAASYSFFRNDATTDSVDVAEIEAGDELYASVNLDSENWCDYKTQFDLKEISAAGGEEITVTLTGRVAMGDGADEPIQGAQIGYWNNGQFKAIKKAVTDEYGKATFKLTRKGDYLLTANGIIKGKNPWSGADIDAPIMPAYCALSITSTTTAEPIDVKVSLCNQGVLATAKDGSAMVEKEVTVTDLNKDGWLNLDEALVATHAAYFEGGAGGYAAQEGEYQGSAYLWVSNLWGVENNTAGYSFYRNDVATATVDAEEVEDDDELYASVNLDVSGCDYITKFDVKEISSAGGEKITVTLTGRVGMGDGADEPIQGAQIGYWDKGTFTAINGAVTDADGKATFMMDKKGDYLLTATGIIKGKNPWTGADIEAPIIAPYSHMSITSDGIQKADVTIASATYTGKALTPAVTVTLDGKTLTKNTDYTVTYSDNIKAGNKAKVTIAGKGSYSGTLTKAFTIKKAKQPAKIVFKNKTFKVKKLKKKKAVYNAVTVKNKQGAVSYKVKYVKKAKKFLKFKNGKITVKKGAKKGTYKITVIVKVKGNVNYLDATMKKNIVIKVK